MFDPNEKASIEVGKLLHNKVLRYLIPALKKYGKEFTFKFGEVNWCGFTIGIDGEVQQNKIFCFCTNTDGEKFNEFLKFVDEQEYNCGHKYYDMGQDIYLFIIEFPFPESFQKFIEGKYSKMYNIEQISKHFRVRFNNKPTTVFNVLTRNKNYERDFIKKVKSDFNTEVIPQGEFEYDYPPVLKQELI